MAAEDSQRLVRWAAARFGPPHSPGAALVSYDMILPHDAFGRIMRANLKVRSSWVGKKCSARVCSMTLIFEWTSRHGRQARGLALPGFEAWGRDLGTQLQRFLDDDEGGWERAVGGDMNAVYEHLLAPADRER